MAGTHDLEMNRESELVSTPRSGDDQSGESI